MLRKIKLVLAWLAILAIAFFIIMNTQSVKLRLPFQTEVHAPLGLILFATAMVGALSAPAIWTLIRWARGKDRNK